MLLAGLVKGSTGSPVVTLLGMVGGKADGALLLLSEGGGIVFVLFFSLGSWLRLGGANNEPIYLGFEAARRGHLLCVFGKSKLRDDEEGLQGGGELVFITLAYGACHDLQRGQSGFD